MFNELEEGQNLELNFQKLGSIAQKNLAVLPVIVQNFQTKEVLILAYTNQEALDLTLKTKIATFWSTSKNQLWIKGETSQDKLEVIEIRINCEQNSLLYLVKPLNQGVCHTSNKNGQKRKSCFYRKITTHGLEKVDNQ